jgi:hypothetical protein
MNSEDTLGGTDGTESLEQIFGIAVLAAVHAPSDI